MKFLEVGREVRKVENGGTLRLYWSKNSDPVEEIQPSRKWRQQIFSFSEIERM